MLWILLFISMGVLAYNWVFETFSSFLLLRIPIFQHTKLPVLFWPLVDTDIKRISK